MKKANRFLALVLALLLCLSMAASALADTAPTSAKQIENAGGTVYFDADGKQVTDTTGLGNNDAVVEMTKTVAVTDTENEFEITLQVKTKQDLRELQTLSPDAAVMLVLDVSNSMERCVHCGELETHDDHQTSVTTYYCKRSATTYTPDYSDWFSGSYRCRYCDELPSNHRQMVTTVTPKCTFKSRLASAQEAAKNFIKQFANNTGAEGTDKRMVAIVSFGSNAKRELDWVDVHNDDKDKTNMTAVNAAIDGLQLGHGKDYDGGTNIEAGLMLAKNNLDATKNAKVKDISNLYTILLTDGKPTYYVYRSSNTTEGPINGSVNWKGDGTQTNFNDVEDVGKEASAIRSLTSWSRLYSICFGKETTNNTTTDVFNTKPFDDWSNANPPVSKNDTIGDWLKKFSNGAYNGESSASGLFDSFGTIIKLINVGAKAWLVEDTMGSYISNVNYIPVKNKEGNGSINNVTDVDRTTGKITWYLLQSDMDDNITDIKTNTDGTVTGVVGYTYKYKIKLDNLAQDHTAGIAYNTNGNATLKYMVADEKGNWPTDEKDLKTGTFAKPSVKSLAGNLEFTKVNENGAALSGAEFTLALKNETDKQWTSTVTSGTDGKVSFTGIPSGHSYTLSETKVPEGYQTMANVDVTVSYGTVSDAGFTKTEAGALTLTNSRKTGTITVEKTFNGLPEGTTLPTVTVSVYDTKGTDATTDDTLAATLTLNATNSWKATSDALPYGTYRFEESGAEVDGYSLTSTFNHTSVTIDDDTPTTGATVALTNAYTQKTGTITVTKSFSGLPDGTRPAAVTVKIFNANDNSDDSELIATLTLTATNDWADSATLPHGTYRLVENGAAVDGYTLSSSFYLANSTTPLETVTISDSTPAAGVNVDLKNTYTQNTGTITVTKSFVDSNGNPLTNVTLPEEITVNILDENNATVDTLTLAASGNWTATSDPLPYGTYQFEESGADVSGYTCVPTFDPTTVTIDGQTPATGAAVALKNTYTQKTSKITIRKVFDGLPDYSRPEITVYIWNTEVSGNDPAAKLTLNADNSWTASAALPCGVYRLDERSPESVNGTYLLASATFSSNDIEFSSDQNGNQIITIDDSKLEKEIDITLTNTYYGKLKIVKNFEFDDGLDLSAIKEVTIELGRKNGDTTDWKANEPISLTADNQWNYVMNAMKPGTYEFRESVTYCNPDYVNNHYNWTTEWINQTVTIEAGQIEITDANTVTCKNIYSLRDAASIELPISKTVTYSEGGNVAPAGARTFKFKMTIADNTPATVRAKASVKPGEYAVSFMGKELTPANGVYFFDMTVNGVGTQTGTLKINGHAADLDNKKITISELTQTESGYALDSRWTYDTTVFRVFTFLNDNGTFNLEYSADPQSETQKGEGVEFVNLYTEVAPEGEEPPTTGGGNAPKTGDNSHFVLWTMLAVLSAAGFLFLMKRRNAHS